MHLENYMNYRDMEEDTGSMAFKDMCYGAHG